MPTDNDCPVCGAVTRDWASATVLRDVPVTYERCTSCGLVRARDVTWLDEAYSSAIAGLDIGLLDRCVVLSDVSAAFLHAAKLRQGPFLDWAGGYGILTRLMRDRGFDFHDHDPMAANVLAGQYRVDDLGSRRFQAVTAFEVLEHLEDPVAQLTDVAARTDVLLVTTQVLPEPTPLPADWAYYALESGQHVTFYTKDSIRTLARRLGFSSSVSGSLVHVMYRGRLPWRARRLVQLHQAAYLVGLARSIGDRRRSLLLDDVDDYRQRLGLPGADR